MAPTVCRAAALTWSPAWQRSWAWRLGAVASVILLVGLVRGVTVGHDESLEFTVDGVRRAQR